MATQNFLDLADQDFARKDYESAAANALRHLEIDPGSYWANLMLGRVSRLRGDETRASTHFQRCIETPDPVRVGAIFEIVFGEMRAGDCSRAPLVDEALVLCEFTPQKRWYFAQLLFLRALIDLKSRFYESADRSLKLAYDYDKTVAEVLFLFPWVREALAAIERVALYPYLRYLLTIARQGESISYGRELAKLGNDVIALEIGAMDGVTRDPLHEHIVGKGWRAILLEPTALMYEQLKKNYAQYDKARCLKLALSDKDGPTTIFRVKPEEIGVGKLAWGHAVSSLHPGGILRHLTDKIVPEAIEAITFETLVARTGLDRIDVLQIDTEGHDYVVFKQIDLARWPMKIVHVELYHVDPVDRIAVLDALSAHGYRYHFDGVDVTGLPEERVARSPSLG